MILRSRRLANVDRLLGVFPVVALVGSRQAGKTTLARQYCESVADFPWQSNYFDMEDPRDRSRLENPMLALERLIGTVVIDEVQHAPEVFSILRVLADRDPPPARFLVLGSASGTLMRQTSESLAGRIAFDVVEPFSLGELPEPDVRGLWVRGGYPRSYVAKDDASSALWRDEFVRTFLDRDVPALGIRVPPATLRRFWSMLAHRHGQLLNASELGRSLGVSHTAIQHYLDILTDTFLVRRLPPWLANAHKREVRSPKIYVRDSGLFHHLARVDTFEQLEGHPQLGASWEGFAMEQVLQEHNVDDRDAFFWAVSSGAELDLVVDRGGVLDGYEFKYTDAPRMTKSIASALENLPLRRVFIVYPGAKGYDVAENVHVMPLLDLVRPS